MTLITPAQLSLTRDAAAPPAVPQRNTATPPPRLAIQQGCVRPLRAQWPTWLRLREVRDEEAAGSNPVTPTVFPQVRALTRVGEGLSCCLNRNEIPPVPQQIRTFDVLINWAPRAGAALRRDEEAASLKSCHPDQGFPQVIPEVGVPWLPLNSRWTAHSGEAGSRLLAAIRAEVTSSTGGTPDSPAGVA